MIDMRQRKLTFALLALLLILFGCKGESPTAPPIAPSPGGGTTPPTNATITLTASNTNPVVNSTSVITATVTQNNQNVPNGTAVQFSTNLGIFTDTAATTTLKTTTNGVATATLTSASSGTATVTAVVNNVSKSITVAFSTQPTTPQPPSTTPTITAVTPSTGRAAGGEQVKITGTNFRDPIRVVFTCEGDVTSHDPSACSGQPPKEAFVVSVSLTEVNVLTPKFDVVSTQAVTASITVITQAGSPTEQPVTKAAAFTFAGVALTPSIRAISPTSGPVGGGTRVTIIGDAFQAPVQVFFGLAEAQVISVNFSQIVALSPRASDTAPGGSGVVTGPVDVKVLNINSGKSFTLPGGFRFLPKMQITTAGPTEGPFTGGTRLKIDGTGFDQPLSVVVGTPGVAAQVISVSGTEIVAITSPITLTSCADVSGPMVVTNTDNGDTATGPIFTYRVPKPIITAISNPNSLGGTTMITVLNALGFARITIGDIAANITAQTVNLNGTTTFSVQIPTTLQLTRTNCLPAGSAPTPTAFDVVYTSATTGCTNTAPKGITVNPAAAPVLFLTPAAFQPFSAKITPATMTTPATVAPSSAQTVTAVNTGTTTLTISGITTAGAGCSQFSLSVPPIPPNIDLNQCESFPLIATFNGSTTPGTVTCTVTVTTNAPIAGSTKALLLVGTSQ